MPTLVETVTFFAPFAFALFLLWAREAYSDRKARQSNQDAPWQIINQEVNELPNVMNGLDEMIMHYEKGAQSPRIFITYMTPVQYARRLAELDGKHAYIYSSYEIEAEGSEKREAYLDSLRDAFAGEADKERRAEIGKAIVAHAVRAKEQTIDLARKELKVFEHITNARKRDQQAVDAYRSLIEAHAAEASSR